MKNVLITGAAGFIGSHLSDYYVSQGVQVIGIDNFDPYYDRSLKELNIAGLRNNDLFEIIEGDICDDATWNQVSVKPDMIFHLAAKAGVLPSIADAAGYTTNNIVGTQKLLEYMKENELSNLVMASSSSVYGNNLKMPFSETDNVDQSISPYAFTKKACEVMAHAYHYLSKMNVICLRFFTVIGPRQRPDLAIRKFIEMSLQDKAIPVYGDGSSARDYTFIDDIIKGIVGSADYINANHHVYEIFNLGNSKPIPLTEMIDTIYELVQKEPKINRLPMQAGDVSKTFADITKAQKLLGYSPDVPFREGVARFYKWYKENLQPH